MQQSVTFERGAVATAVSMLLLLKASTAGKRRATDPTPRGQGLGYQNLSKYITGKCNRMLEI